jgi:tetratricopeptide (TPR) repeat protein
VLLRSVVALVAITVCVFAILLSARFGYARLLGRYAVAANSIASADRAVSLAPADAEVHRARASVLNRLQMPGEARKSFEIATRLRYRDDYLWLELGTTRDALGDTTAALAAFDQAVQWAPHYSHTLWQRGNLKLRMGQYDGAFADLRSAAAGKTSLLPSLIDLAWGLSRGDVKTAEQLIQIDNDYERLAFAQFLAQRGKGDECVEQVRLLSTALSEQNRHQLVRELIAAKAFRKAFELWRTDKPVAQPAIVDGGFEELPLRPFEDRGFGWFVFAKTEPAVEGDESEKLSGKKSLRLRFLSGEWKGPDETISQRIVVEPERRYRITFGVKTKDIVTGGPPAIVVKDAVTNERLGQSEEFPTPSSDWQTMRFEFSTKPGAQAILLEFMRVIDACSPCPIFGELWLDDLVIDDVTTVNSQR